VILRPSNASEMQKVHRKPADEKIGLEVNGQPASLGWYTFRHYSDFRTIPGEGRTETCVNR
jgi:hypothetical protein